MAGNKSDILSLSSHIAAEVLPVTEGKLRTPRCQGGKKRRSGRQKHNTHPIWLMYANVSSPKQLLEHCAKELRPQTERRAELAIENL